jgi:Ca2+-binding EF-hand superfamily protein
MAMTIDDMYQGAMIENEGMAWEEVENHFNKIDQDGNGMVTE